MRLRPFCTSSSAEKRSRLSGDWARSSRLAVSTSATSRSSSSSSSATTERRRFTVSSRGSISSIATRIRASGVRSSCDTLASSSFSDLRVSSMRLAISSNDRASLPTSSSDLIPERAERSPRPNDSAVAVRRSSGRVMDRESGYTSARETRSTPESHSTIRATRPPSGTRTRRYASGGPPRRWRTGAANTLLRRIHDEFRCGWPNALGSTAIGAPEADSTLPSRSTTETSTPSSSCICSTVRAIPSVSWEGGNMRVRCSAKRGPCRKIPRPPRPNRKLAPRESANTATITPRKAR